MKWSRAQVCPGGLPADSAFEQCLPKYKDGVAALTLGDGTCTLKSVLEKSDESAVQILHKMLPLYFYICITIIFATWGS